MRRFFVFVTAAMTVVIASQAVFGDPCGMVPPIYTGPGQPITRIGDQQTYVFYKDGVETFIIRPGYEGKVDEFGMLIPFPAPPALRKVPDHIFPHLANAVDPPEVVLQVYRFEQLQKSAQSFDAPANENRSGGALAYHAVRVVRQEAVGMYEVAVLEAGSAAALKKWIDDHGFKYPDGMDEACNEYVKDRWCFVAVKTRVGQKAGVDPQPGQRGVDAKLPDGSTFDGHVQAMGFRFPSKELVVPMRLSAFNEGELRNIVYLLTQGPRKIRSIPEEYVVRQISGEQLLKNLTQPLPLRIIGGTINDLNDWQRKNLPAQRNPEQHNGAARDVFASDLLAISSGKLTLAHEQKEKELLNIGEYLGLRGGDIDALHEQHLAEQRKQAVKATLADVKEMTLTVVDGDFPREVLARKNLRFAQYQMPSRRNKTEVYDPKVKGPAGNKPGVLHLGAIPPRGGHREKQRGSEEANSVAAAPAVFTLLGSALLAIAALSYFRRPERETAGNSPAGTSNHQPGRVARWGAVLLTLLAISLFATTAFADPCGMVPPIYTGPGQPIARVGDQMTYVFYKDGVETFVIRPGFTGKVDEFGMLIPFPAPPALRKVSDNIFAHVASAIDPPEVVVDLRPVPAPSAAAFGNGGGGPVADSDALKVVRKDEVRVLREEAVGMYEVAVLEAGSAAALKKWMDDHGYVYPKGMDKVCEDYVDMKWCFVAVKTKVGTKNGADPRPGQRKVNTKLPSGSAFDGAVQAMGFRFPSEQLVVPMRLSAFNEGELRNIVYLLSDKPQKVRAIPEEYVVRQVSGEQLHQNVSGPLPLRIIGGTQADLTEWHLRNLAKQRDPAPHSGAARDLFAGDVQAAASGKLSLDHEEKEKELLRIGEALGLRGQQIDALHEQSLAEMREKIVADSLADIKELTLTVIDGDFPREVLGKHNLNFAEYRMPSRRNKPVTYDAKQKGPAAQRTDGVVVRGALKAPEKPKSPQSGGAAPPLAPDGAALPKLGIFIGLVLITTGLFFVRRRTHKGSR